MEVIADVAIGTQVQVYNLVSRQWQPGVVKDYWEPGGFLEVRCGKRGQQVFSGECVVVENGGGWVEVRLVEKLFKYNLLLYTML